MAGWQRMESAPRDGTRILIQQRVHHFSSALHKYVPAGTQWIECRFVDGAFKEWCGNNRTQSTGSIDPIAWAPLPNGEEQ
jgi:hypothetical protein